MTPFASFSDELQRIQLEKHAGLMDSLRGAGKWLRGQYAQLGVAAGDAMHGYRTMSPITGQPTVPVVGTIRRFLGNKLPAPTRPPGPIAGGVQKVLGSKPAKVILPALDQASEFWKLGNAHYIEYCSCGNVISRCRCRGPHEERVTPNGCVDCRGKEKTAEVSPYQQKTQYSCSAACLKAVLEHWGADHFAELEIMHAIGVQQKGGAEVDQIAQAAKALGFDAYDKSFESLDEARELTDRGIPIIADIQSFNHPGSGHYVVITSIDDDVVHLMDPNTDGNERVITRAEMEKRWWDRRMKVPHELMPRWGVVVTTKERQ